MKQGGAEGELHMAISTQGAETEEKWRRVKSQELCELCIW